MKIITIQLVQVFVCALIFCVAPCAIAQNTLTKTTLQPKAATAQTPNMALLLKADIVLFRHANAPGFGDPLGFKLSNCASQRNLDDVGRAQSKALGQAIKTSGVKVSAVWASQWCRARETAQLLGLGAVSDMPAFNSFFAEMDKEGAQSKTARAQLIAHKQAVTNKGLLIVVTHQVNIQALTGISPAAGEGVALRVLKSKGTKTRSGENAAFTLEVVGRVQL